MKKWAVDSAKSVAGLGAVDSIATAQIPAMLDAWILDGQYQNRSENYLDDRKKVVGLLLWFLRHRELTACGKQELKQFFAYVRYGHTESGGRWGNPRYTTPASERTVANYYAWLRVFFGFLVEEGIIEINPYASLSPPHVPKRQPKPFSVDQIRALLAAAEKTAHPRRDVAILLLMLDTGMRAAEICSLRVGDIDTAGRTASIRGKGGKTRQIHWHPVTGKAILHYLRERDDPRPNHALFISDRGKAAGDGLQPDGLGKLIKRIGKRAGVVVEASTEDGANKSPDRVRCSPHTFRHSFALNYLEAGGEQFSLMALMGHTGPEMTNRYVHAASMDIQKRHAAHSPVGHLLKKK